MAGGAGGHRQCAVCAVLESSRPSAASAKSAENDAAQGACLGQPFTLSRCGTRRPHLRPEVGDAVHAVQVRQRPVHDGGAEVQGVAGVAVQASVQRTQQPAARDAHLYAFATARGKGFRSTAQAEPTTGCGRPLAMQLARAERCGSREMPGSAGGHGACGSLGWLPLPGFEPPRRMAAPPAGGPKWRCTSRGGQQSCLVAHEEGVALPCNGHVLISV